jgi:hypothetical protein
MSARLVAKSFFTVVLPIFLNARLLQPKSTQPAKVTPFAGGNEATVCHVQ